MPVPIRYTLAHGPVIAALGRVAMSGLRKETPSHAPVVPSPWVEARLPPRPADIVRDYIRNAGGDPGWYKNRVPAHFFPQGFARPARLQGLVSARAYERGCRIENRARCRRVSRSRRNPHRVDTRYAARHRAEGDHRHVAGSGGHRRRDARVHPPRRDDKSRRQRRRRAPRSATPTRSRSAHPRERRA
jgi:hypothetical protein